MITAMETNNHTMSESDFTYAADSITGFFNDMAQVHMLLETLLKNGFDESDITFLGPVDELNSMDMTGDHHGIYGRLVRSSQRFFKNNDFELISKANEEMEKGHYVLTIVALNDEEKNIVSRLMKQHGGSDVKCSNALAAENMNIG